MVQISQPVAGYFFFRSSPMHLIQVNYAAINTDIDNNKYMMSRGKGMVSFTRFEQELKESEKKVEEYKQLSHDERVVLKIYHKSIASSYSMNQSTHSLLNSLSMILLMVSLIYALTDMANVWLLVPIGALALSLLFLIITFTVHHKKATRSAKEAELIELAESMDQKRKS
ncbi:hypothetical protein [Paenibacillus campinasensis]|uniref:Uncharacterized protein n=1 Tax=Paenibacillus campinasensis TaxID=66347 RepID=A0A268EIA1_9BACL|nr:hypothetical protein [Paenibacillus campinasensis]PAD72832.1 hypothetical protein CHH67_21225 [Paenibacillus campinasensis]